MKKSVTEKNIYKEGHCAFCKGETKLIKANNGKYYCRVCYSVLKEQGKIK